MTTTKRGKSVPDGFPDALAALLRARKLKVPAGLTDAPPEAYAAQPAEFVDELAKLDDEELARRAQHIAGWAKRQEARARSAWESSPLIKEIKRRKLKVPPVPKRNVGAAVPIKKPLSQWSDVALIRAASEWSRRGS